MSCHHPPARWCRRMSAPWIMSCLLKLDSQQCPLLTKPTKIVMSISVLCSLIKMLSGFSKNSSRTKRMSTGPVGNTHKREETLNFMADTPLFFLRSRWSVWSNTGDGGKLRRLVSEEDTDTIQRRLIQCRQIITIAAVSKRQY